MDVSGYKGYKVPTPVKGQVMLEIVDAEDVSGKRADDNGEVSKGFKLTVAIKAPEDALMTDGTTAVGYTFSQTWWLPRQSLKDAKPQVAGRMKRDFAHLIEAVFGADFPETIDNSEWIGREVFAYVAPAFDDFNNEDICEITAVLTAADIERKAGRQ